jgi:metal-responsive CopG/Arc/MetJ family transcriptional regulator
MRMHIVLEDELVAELDRRVGPRQRSAFITQLIRRGIDDERRWDDIEASLGVLADTSHEWDANPAEWVRTQRRGDQRRAG